MFRLEDPFFGRMGADDKILRPAMNWRGTVAFQPAATEIGVTVLAGRDGPTEQDRAVFRFIESAYNTIAVEVSLALADYLERKNDPGCDVVRRQGHILDGIYIWGPSTHGDDFRFSIYIRVPGIPNKLYEVPVHGITAQREIQEHAT